MQWCYAASRESFNVRTVLDQQLGNGLVRTPPPSEVALHEKLDQSGRHQHRQADGLRLRPRHLVIAGAHAGEVAKPEIQDSR